MRIFILLLLSMMFASDALGAPRSREVPVQIVHLSGPYGLDAAEAFVAADEAAKYIRAKVGVDVQIRVFKTEPDHSGHLNTFDLMVRRLDWLGRHFIQRGDIEPKHITHFILPPAWLEGKKLIMGGWAKRVCSVGSPGINYGYSNAMFSNVLLPERPYRFTASIAAMAHEIMHSLGASHVESQTIMHPAALSFSTNLLPEVDEVSIKQIKRCLTFAQRRQLHAHQNQER